MDVRLQIAVASQGVCVTGFCRTYGISREAFYFWKRRYEAEGLDGLTARSRAPLSSPQRLGFGLEDAIVGLRKELAELGVDAGPATIQWHLQDRGERPVPSISTIWRVLVRRGFVTPTWETFCEACEGWGVPLGQLTDNGLNFSGKLRGFEVFFEIHLRAIGVVPKTSRPYHPQTCGKVERFQQTLKKWLRRRPVAADIAELQAHIDEFVAYYNHKRPHRAIGRITPAERWAATPQAINLGIALPGPAHAAIVAVDSGGVVQAGRYRVNIGKTWAGHTARVHQDHTHIAVFIGHQLVRALTIDPTRTYQGLTARRYKPRLR